MSEANRIHYPFRLPDLPTLCPECGQMLARSRGLAGIETEDLKFFYCHASDHAYQARADADLISGSRVWAVYPI